MTRNPNLNGLNNEGLGKLRQALYPADFHRAIIRSSSELFPLPTSNDISLNNFDEAGFPD